MKNLNFEWLTEEFKKQFGETKSIISNVSNDEYFKINLSFKNQSSNEDPKFMTEGSSGFDLRANLKESVYLKPKGGIAIIPTGLFFDIPKNFEIQIRPRSGLAAKNGVTVLNSPGTIDSDYTGEIKIILINHGENEFVVQNGDRIAQAVIASVLSKSVIKLNKVDEISDKETRGNNGFGSSGIK